MGDKSPKSKARDQKQKAADKQAAASKARAKQDQHAAEGVTRGKK